MPVSVAKPLPYPERKWGIYGFANAGKSTFAASMKGPLLMIDADHRASEIQSLCSKGMLHLEGKGDVDACVPDIADALKGCHGDFGGAKTICVDSLTAIISPLVQSAQIRAEEGQFRNKSMAWKEKAAHSKLLQDCISHTGLDVLFVWHNEAGVFGGNATVNQTIPENERMRLMRSLNMILEVLPPDDNGVRAVRVDWSRKGPSGVVVKDTEGFFRGVPERIEMAVFDNVHIDYYSKSGAINKAVKVGRFKDTAEATAKYEALKADIKPQSPQEMFKAWEVLVKGS